MKAYIVSVVLTALVFSEANALQCYSCSDCENGDDKVLNVDQCGLIDTKCYKEIEDDGDVNRGCTNLVVCTAKETIPGVCVHEEVKPCFICCEGDTCNSATGKSVSILSAIFTVVAYFLISYN